jgi:hypothetical protein
MDEKRIDTAAEPVDHQDDEFMDTGVLHERPKKGVRGQHPHLLDEDEESADGTEGSE